MTRNLALFAAVGLLFLLTGMFQSWNLALSILNISASFERLREATFASVEHPARKAIIVTPINFFIFSPPVECA